MSGASRRSVADGQAALAQRLHRRASRGAVARLVKTSVVNEITDKPWPSPLQLRFNGRAATFIEASAPAGLRDGDAGPVWLETRRPKPR